MVKFLPCFIKHLKVILTQRVSALFCSHIEVLQDDGNIHIDDHQKGHDDVRGEEHDADCWAATVASDRRPRVLNVWLTVWRRIHDGTEEPVPASGCGDHEQTDHAVPKCLKIKHVINHGLLLHIGKVGHAEDGEDEHNEKQKEANVEEGRK